MPPTLNEAVAGSWFPRQMIARILPFAVYVLFLALQSTLESNIDAAVYIVDYRWLYAARVTLVSAVMMYFWRDYTELRRSSLDGGAKVQRFSEPLVAVLVGALVFVLWINLSEGWVTQGSGGGGFVAADQDGSYDWPLIVVRIVGASIVVPIMEELFWRSFIQRWIDKPQFIDASPQHCSTRALLITSILFGFEHDQWLAGFLAGLAYGYLYRRTGRLWIPIAAHAVTNLMLGFWVVGTRQWHFW